MNQNTPAIHIDGIIIPVTPHPEHEYTLTTAEVAAGYGVEPANIRKTLERHRDELLEGKHFSSVTNSHAGNLQRVTTIWTKRGIIRLGFFIKSERAKRFRDMAEDLVLREWEQPTLSIQEEPAPFRLTDCIARKLEAFEIGRHGTVSTLSQLCDLYRRQCALDTPADLGRGEIQRAIFARRTSSPILLVPASGKYRREIAYYADLYSQSTRTIKRWTSIGRKAGDPAPLDQPSRMADWFARHHKQTAPWALHQFADQTEN